jgi:hypothetical protein
MAGSRVTPAFANCWGSRGGFLVPVDESSAGQTNAAGSVTEKLTAEPSSPSGFAAGFLFLEF